MGKKGARAASIDVAPVYAAAGVPDVPVGGTSPQLAPQIGRFSRLLSSSLGNHARLNSPSPSPSPSPRSSPIPCSRASRDVKVACASSQLERSSNSSIAHAGPTESEALLPESTRLRAVPAKRRSIADLRRVHRQPRHSSTFPPRHMRRTAPVPEACADRAPSKSRRGLHMRKGDRARASAEIARSGMRSLSSRSFRAIVASVRLPDDLPPAQLLAPSLPSPPQAHQLQAASSGRLVWDACAHIRLLPLSSKAVYRDSGGEGADKSRILSDVSDKTQASALSGCCASRHVQTSPVQGRLLPLPSPFAADIFQLAAARQLPCSFCTASGHELRQQADEATSPTSGGAELGLTGMLRAHRCGARRRRSVAAMAFATDAGGALLDDATEQYYGICSAHCQAQAAPAASRYLSSHSGASPLEGEAVACAVPHSPATLHRSAQAAPAAASQAGLLESRTAPVPPVSCSAARSTPRSSQFSIAAVRTPACNDASSASSDAWLAFSTSPPATASQLTRFASESVAIRRAASLDSPGTLLGPLLVPPGSPQRVSHPPRSPVSPGVGGGGGYWELVQEIAVLQRLDHPNIIALHEVRLTLNPIMVALHEVCLTLNLNIVALHKVRLTLNPSIVALHEVRLTGAPRAAAAA